MLDTLTSLFKHKYSIDSRLESRLSFINHEVTSVTGVRLGLAFRRKLRLGIGVSWLKTPVKTDFYVTNSFGKTDTVTKYMKFYYFCYYADFVFYKTKHWQLSVPIQVGTGRSWFQEKSTYVLSSQPKYYLLLYEPGITVQYKVTKWAGVGADVAYRFVLRTPKRPENNLNSFCLSFKILFWFDQLFFEVFPKSPITKKYGPAVW
ncbi:MAG: hypothetical protein JNL60_08355 [Bacteroidia bacterium]|nr:hypothetical protein [Bacteroidia bacterium]